VQHLGATPLKTERKPALWKTPILSLFAEEKHGVMLTFCELCAKIKYRHFATGKWTLA